MFRLTKVLRRAEKAPSCYVLSSDRSVKRESLSRVSEDTFRDEQPVCPLSATRCAHYMLGHTTIACNMVLNAELCPSPPGEPTRVSIAFRRNLLFPVKFFFRCCSKEERGTLPASQGKTSYCLLAACCFSLGKRVFDAVRRSGGEHFPFPLLFVVLEKRIPSKKHCTRSYKPKT